MHAENQYTGIASSRDATSFYNHHYEGKNYVYNDKWAYITPFRIYHRRNNYIN